MKGISAPTVPGNKEGQNKQRYLVHFSGYWNYQKTVIASSEEEAIEIADGFDAEDVEVDLDYDIAFAGL